MPLLSRSEIGEAANVAGLDRTFEAVVLDWDSNAFRRSHVVRRRVEALCAASVDVAAISGSSLRTVDTQLGARPAGPGRLLLGVDHGSALYQVDEHGPQLIRGRRATPAEQAALDRAGRLVVERLAALGMTSVVSPVRSLSGEVVVVFQDGGARSRADEARGAGAPTLSTVAAVAMLAGKEVGLANPRVTAGVTQLEIGLTDKTDSMTMVVDELATRGVGPGLTLVVGDEFGRVGDVPGCSSWMLSGAVTAVSVGVEPGGVPPGVLHRPGGPGSFRVLVDEQLKRRTRLRVPSIEEDPEWVLTLNCSTTEGARRDEALLSLGDGVLGLRGSHEDPDPHEAPLLLAAGIYTGQGAGQHLLEGPWPLSLGLRTSRVRERRQLDLRSGVLVREGAEGGDGIRTLRFVSAGHRGAVVQRAEGPPGAIPSGAPLRPHIAGDTTFGVRADGGNWARSKGDRGGISMIASQATSRDAGRCTIERLTAFAVDSRRPPSIRRAALLLDRLEERGFERLLSEHRAVWAQRWNDACVWIPDDPSAQLSVRFALFQLWNNVGSQGEAAVGARGLTGPGYAGHVFWDADVFVLPAMATMSPRAARAMLEYRLRRLPQARARARSLRMDGARFPWESAAGGDDVTPTAGRVNGEWVPILTGTLEEHIVADVAWAASWYADWTGDAAFIAGPGRLLLTDTARYWASRVEVDADGRAHLRHVIGPDEYHDDIDDNSYTNLLAGWNLRRAASMVSSSDEAARWLALADALVDGYDPELRRHEQFTGYYTLEPLLADEVGSPPFAADLLLGPTRTSGSQIIKQPDVLMAHHLIPGDMPTGSLIADLDFYLPRTAHGSSLSPAISAALLARAGRPDDAIALFDISLRLDLDDLTGITSAGLHMATLGGVWQALLFGFAGARVDTGVLSLDPHLPTRWPSVRLRFRCLGRHVDLRMTHESTVITVSGPLRIRTPACDPVQVSATAQLLTTATGWTVRR